MDRMTVVSRLNESKRYMLKWPYLLTLKKTTCTEGFMVKKGLDERFAALEQEYQTVISSKYIHTNVLSSRQENYVDTAKYNNWVARVKRLLEDSYGKDSDYYIDFNNTSSLSWSSNYNSLIRHYKPLFDAARDDLVHTAESADLPAETSALSLVLNILSKFPAFVRQLKERHDNRTTFEINDEYDVQDLVHALLILHFDDIREEEASPSFAGSSSRQDFLLKKERIVIEVKKTRKSLGASKIGEELIIDMARYREHPDCDTLICFVYDPEGRVKNPKGVISDLERGDKEGKTRVVIAQF